MSAPAPPAPLEVIWHDLECHGYAADLPLWHELAGREGGPVLDVGAGTGRVALDLAAAGHAVHALDADAALLAALRERAARRGVEVATVLADAQSFDLGGTRFPLVVVPMQTVQLLGDRGGFLAAARRHLRPGGLLAAAISEELEPYDADVDVLPSPDVGERAGWRFASQPVAVHAGPEVLRIDRLRVVTAPDGERTEAANVVRLARLTAAELEAEGARAGLRPEPRRVVPATDEHVGSTVVMLRG